MLWILLIWFLVLDAIQSQSIVKRLPGFSGELPFRLETGYVGVGQFDDVQLFYYFIESERSPRDDPLVLWLTGGPGCSSLSGLLYEIGPLKFDYVKSRGGNKPTLALNPYSWTKVANIIFLDQPVGTGFSYSTTQEGYYVGDYSSTAETYQFLVKWLRNVHPEFLPNPLYIAGDSYSGVTVPMVVQLVLDGNRAGHLPQLNLKGYALGNPLTDEIGDLNSRVTFAHRLAVISDQLYKALKKNCKGEYVNANLTNVACALALRAYNMSVAKLDSANILEPNCRFMSPKPNIFQWSRNVVGEDLDLIIERMSSQVPPELWCRDDNYILSYIWANDKAVQRALHVREGTKDEWIRCNETSTYAYEVTNVVGYHQNFTRTQLQALVYSGDHDMVVPYVGTEAWIQRLNMSLTTEWEPWLLEGQVAGYTMKYTHDSHVLTYTTVKGAGHTAPEYKPAQCLAMVDRWFAYYPL
ncbi:hypothetical protein CDL15_Pgr003322 [Punica granatum]|nr:hypothetical protein CDL15_Pgr003322 [Punica granatum]PKI71396.1 hypothetical protein CRG98_008255 [Punica granatum]